MIHILVIIESSYDMIYHMTVIALPKKDI